MPHRVKKRFKTDNVLIYHLYHDLRSATTTLNDLKHILTFPNVISRKRQKNNCQTAWILVLVPCIADLYDIHYCNAGCLINSWASCYKLLAFSAEMEKCFTNWLLGFSIMPHASMWEIYRSTGTSSFCLSSDCLMADQYFKDTARTTDSIEATGSMASSACLAARACE